MDHEAWFPELSLDQQHAGPPQPVLPRPIASESTINKEEEYRSFVARWNPKPLDGLVVNEHHHAPDLHPLLPTRFAYHVPI